MSQPRNERGMRVILGMAPAEYDQMDMTYDPDGNMTGIVFSIRGVQLSRITLQYNSDGCITSATVSDP